MMVQAQTLQQQLAPVFDMQADPATFPQTPAQVADFWAAAVAVWALPVLPATTTAPAAQAAFRAALLAGLLVRDPHVLESAFQAHAAALAPGMAPAFVATPPPGQPDFGPVYTLGSGGAAGPDCLALLAQLATAYLHTGTAIAAAGGPAVTWQ